MTNQYSKECIDAFLKNQSQLFDEDVAETPEEAKEFLEDCMAMVADNLGEVKKYFKDNMDVSGMTDEEIKDACEVFEIPGGKYLIVEG